MQTYENEEMIVPVNAIYAIAQGSQGPMSIVSCFNKNANYKNYVSLSHSTIAAKGCGSWEVDRGRGRVADKICPYLSDRRENKRNRRTCKICRNVHFAESIGQL